MAGKVYGILPDVLGFPDEDKWNFRIDEDYIDDDGYEHKLLIAKTDNIQVNVNESGVYIMVPFKFWGKVEKILSKFNRFNVETSFDDIGETFDINIDINYELDEEDKVYVYDEDDIKTLEKIIQEIYYSI